MITLIRAAACGLLIMAPGIVSAATLSATFASNLVLPAFTGFKGGVAGESAFVINFDDSLGNTAGVVEANEFLSFAWVNNPFISISPGASNGQEFFTLLGVAPPIPGVVAGFVVPSLTNPFSPNPTNWIFRESPGSSTGFGIAATAFTYSITLPPPPNPNVVPLPAALPMLASAFLGLLAIRRRKHRTI